MRILICCLLLLWAAPSLAQSAPAVRYYPSAQLKASVASAADSSSRTMVNRLEDRGGYNYMVIRRDQSGEPEVHAAWDDVIVVEAGAGTLLHSGTLSGGRQTAPGETRGGEITAGVAQPVAAGDMIVVPAGVPHQFQLKSGQSVTYVVVKVRAASRRR